MGSEGPITAKKANDWWYVIGKVKQKKITRAMYIGTPGRGGDSGREVEEKKQFARGGEEWGNI